MSGSIGSLKAFDPAVDKWEDYLDQFESYLEANDIVDEEKKRSILLTVIGIQNISVIRSLCAPIAPKNMAYSDLIDKCSRHFTKKMNEMTCRVRFYKRFQRENETFDDYVAALRTLAHDCQFDDPVTMVRDRFVSGLRDNNMQSHLCISHEYSGLTIDRALEIVKQMYPTMSARPPTGNCYRCGYTNHTPDNCFHKNATCSKCSKVGHLDRACKINVNPKPTSSDCKNTGENRRSDSLNNLDNPPPIPKEQEFSLRNILK